MSVSPRRTVICSVNQARRQHGFARRACPADSASRDRPRGSPASMVGLLAVLRAAAQGLDHRGSRRARCAAARRRARERSPVRTRRRRVDELPPLPGRLRIARLAHQEGAEHAGTEADGERQGRGRGQQLAARHSEGGRAEQALYPTWRVFRPARRAEITGP